jgi:hypothetical protein
MQSKSVSKSFSIQEQHLSDIQKLAEKHGMNDSEIVQLGVDIVRVLDDKNMLLKFIKMTMERE